MIFFENKVLYTVEGEVPEESYTIPFGEANVVREGDDVTVVAIGRMVGMAQQAAEELAADGVEVEIVDLRTTSPLDEDTVYESVSGPGAGRGRPGPVCPQRRQDRRGGPQDHRRQGRGLGMTVGEDAPAG